VKLPTVNLEVAAGPTFWTMKSSALSWLVSVRTVVAVAAVDCGGRVFALLGGQAFGLGVGVGQVGAEAVRLGAQLRARGLEGGGAVGLALPEGSLPFGGGLRPFCLRSVKKPGYIAAFPASRDGPPGALVPPPQADRDWQAGGPLATAELLVDGEHPLGGHCAEQGDGRGADLRRVGQDLADAVAPVFAGSTSKTVSFVSTSARP
jgi:hypothetical protein